MPPLFDISVDTLLSRRRVLFAAALAPALTQPCAAQTPDRPAEEVPFVVTPPLVVERMLQMAELTSLDRLADLGSGDGRIVIAAAKRGTFARGYEIDGALVALSKRRAIAAGVIDRAEFLTQDIFDANYAEYSVVTLYLLPEYNVKLRPKLLQQLKPGSRIVSHEWDMGDWEADEMLTVRTPTKPLGNDKAHRVYLWHVPAQMSGRWRFRIDGQRSPVAINFTQQFQKLEATPDLGTVRAVGLRGKQLSMLWNDGSRTWRLVGEIEGNRARGLVGSIAEEHGKASWSAERL